MHAPSAIARFAVRSFDLGAFAAMATITTTTTTTLSRVRTRVSS